MPVAVAGSEDVLLGRTQVLVHSNPALRVGDPRFVEVAGLGRDQSACCGSLLAILEVPPNPFYSGNGEESMIRSALVALDGSAASKAAVEMAIRSVHTNYRCLQIGHSISQSSC